jgi:hypothetical protein
MNQDQGRLFDGGERIIKSPLCRYVPHCGHRATVGPPEVRPRCVNRIVTCLTCGNSVTRSERTEASA